MKNQLGGEDLKENLHEYNDILSIILSYLLQLNSSDPSKADKDMTDESDYIE
jgi:hypothetical protein